MDLSLLEEAMRGVDRRVVENRTPFMVVGLRNFDY